MKVSWIRHIGGWGKNIFKKSLQGQDGKELFRKTKEVFIKIKSPSHLLPCKLLHQCVS